MSNSRICVAVRKRPLPDGGADVVETPSPNCIVNEPKIKYDLTPYTDRHTFTFDVVFSEQCTNAQVYESCCLPLIDTVFSHGNATCFAYGQTGSGKTYTMLGSPHEPGLYAIAAREIFHRAKKLNAEVYVSLYEIYGRKIFDLLHNHERLFAREDAEKVINICGLSEHRVTDIQEIFDVITAGSAYRAAGVTSANSESSRSHAVLQIEVREGANVAAAGGGAGRVGRRGPKTIGRISFIDLAGNERGADTFDCDRKTRMEGAEINKSLLALKECIRALGMGKSHVPFRGSILTEVLRDSFTGNSRTTMIATISPTAHHCVNTLNTLRYTQRVKDLGTGPGGAVKIEQVVGAANNNNNAGGGRRNTSAGNNNNNNNNNVAAAGQAANGAGRRRPFEAAAPIRNRPEWVSDFVDSTALAAGHERLPTPVSAHNNNNNNNAGSRAQTPPLAVSPPTTSPGGSVTAAPPLLHSEEAGGNANAVRGSHSAQGRPLTEPPPSKARKTEVKVKDPKIATIVQSHIAALEEFEDDDEDDEEEEEGAMVGVDLQRGGGSSSNGNGDGASPTSAAAMTLAPGQKSGLMPKEEERQVRKVHAYIVDEIAKAEERLVALHRRHIDAKMTGIKEEIRAIQSFEDTDAVDEYVSRVRSLLMKQRSDMDQILAMLNAISLMLKDEEDLSNTLSSSIKTR